MSQTPVSTKPTTKRLLGNSNPSSMEVHDLNNEKGQCQVATIIANRHGVTFTSGTLAQAHRLGYDNCHWCIGNSKR